jgi:hypothetical protein
LPGAELGVLQRSLVHFGGFGRRFQNWMIFAWFWQILYWEVEEFRCVDFGVAKDFATGLVVGGSNFVVGTFW